MKKKLALLLFCLTAVVGIAQDRTIKGKVTDGKSPLENVNIQVVDKGISTYTDADGNYEIAIATGDRLEYSYNGMRTISIKIEDVTRILNPIMIPDVTELEEVEVAASNRRSQRDLEEDYTINKNIIRTAYGYLDADRAAGNIRFLNEDQINPINLCILDLLRGKFGGVSVVGSCNGLGGAVFIRGLNSIANNGGAIFDIDGLIVTEAPWWIDVNNIKRIAILANLSTTTPYGNLGRGGVVVINTIGGNPSKGKIVDRARLRNNYATGKVLTQTDIEENAPTYLKEFNASSSFAASKAVYEEFEGRYANSPYFYLDAYTHFVEQWNEVDYADAIIANSFSQFRDNAVLLKALAYTYESQGRVGEANEMYKEAFILRPNYAQSYMDMANSYRNLNEPRQSASMYARYDYLIKEGFMEADTIGFGPILYREFNNLLMLNRAAVVEGGKANKLFVARDDFKGTRLVFEWSDGEAEFELQFVNPENQYYKWKHSLADNPEEIAREKDFGYNVKEYLIDESLPGTWRINVNYLGNKSLTPTYLKATIYYNYGSRSQRKETQVYKLSLKNSNQELFSVQSSGNLAK